MSNKMQAVIRKQMSEATAFMIGDKLFIAPEGTLSPYADHPRIDITCKLGVRKTGVSLKLDTAEEVIQNGIAGYLFDTYQRERLFVAFLGFHSLREIGTESMDQAA